ncbi:MAG: HlyD family efflux transporter periplasmic adaptor subunit, partial [bacterium]|nr:HlyD family efflux transporter periplasmic adaptor subunit [bacterium]
MRNVFIIIIIVISLVCLTACGVGEGTGITAPGVVDGDIITLKAQVSGTVDRLDLAEGKSVGEGDVLVTINSDKLKNQLNELDITLKEIENNREKLKKKAVFVRSNLGYLKKQVKRFRRLKKANSVSGEKLEAMELRKLEVETSLFDISRSLRALELRGEKVENKREYLNLLLADYVIKSPVSRGVIIEMFVSRGETVFPGAAIADVLDMSSLFIEAFLEGREVSALKLGMEVRVLVDGLEGKALGGTVSYFGRKAEFSPKYIIS